MKVNDRPVKPGDTVTLKPSRFGWDAHQGPVKVLEVPSEGDDLLLDVGVWGTFFHADRIEGAQ